MRFIKLTANIIPKKKQFKSCDYDLKYNFRLNDNLVLTNDDFENLKEELKISKKKLYNKIKLYESYNFKNWNKKEVIKKKKFLITKYSSENVEVIKFRIKVYYLNSKILKNNILINRDSEDFIDVVVPISK